MNKLLKFFPIYFFLAAGFLLIAHVQAFAENERYKAIPMHNGGIFIIDTRDGHTWTWSNSGGHVSKDGKSNRLKYQGNVIKNIHDSKEGVSVQEKGRVARNF